MGLIGREMFAVDGCKLPSNASKEWSGTRADFKKKCIKLENGIKRIVKRHREADLTEAEDRVRETEEQYIGTLKKQVKKKRTWLDDKHQVIVGVEAFGEATDYNLLGQMVEVT